MLHTILLRNPMRTVRLIIRILLFKYKSDTNCFIDVTTNFYVVPQFSQHGSGVIMNILFEKSLIIINLKQLITHMAGCLDMV